MLILPARLPSRLHQPYPKQFVFLFLNPVILECSSVFRVAVRLGLDEKGGGVGLGGVAEENLISYLLTLPARLPSRLHQPYPKQFVFLFLNPVILECSSVFRVAVRLGLDEKGGGVGLGGVAEENLISYLLTLPARLPSHLLQP